MRNLILFIFLVAVTQTAFGQWYWGSKSGRSAAVNLTDRIASSKDITIGIGSDDPTTTPKNDSQGSLYLNSTGLYRKTDNGSSTNWSAALFGSPGTGTDECIARWNGTGVFVLQDSVVCITDLGVITGITQLNVDNLRLDGNDLSSTNVNGNITVTPNGSGVVDVASSVLFGTNDNYLGDRLGTFNLYIGVNSGLNSNSSSNSNVGLGYQTLYFNTSGQQNMAIGYNSMLTNTTGNANTAIGDNSLRTNSTGVASVAIGTGALYFSVADSNTSVGHNSSLNTSSGSSNTVVGRQALLTNQTGSNNVALGFEAGYSATGSGNVFLGYQAGRAETGSNRLYIDNSSSAEPLIGGSFSSDEVTIGGNLIVTGLTASLPVKTNASKQLVSAAIDLASATEVTGVLDEPNGGTNQSTYTTGDLLYASGANTLTKRGIGSSGDILTVVGGVPAWAVPAPAGVLSIGLLDTLPKSFDGAAISSSVLYMQTADATHAGLISSQDQTIAGAKTFSTPIALNSGGTNKSLTANNGGLVWSDSDSMEITSPGTAGQAVIWNGSAAPSAFNPTTANVIYGGTGGVLAHSDGMKYQASTSSLTVGAVVANSTTIPSRMNVMTTTQKNAVTDLEEGKYVWDSDVNKQYNYNGSAWELVTSTADVVVAPGTGTAVYSVVAFGGASATTVCSSSPCTLYGTGLKGEISSVTRSSTGTYAVVMSRTYTNLICHFFARGPSDVIVRQDGGFYGSSTNTIANAIAVTRSGGAPEDSFGSVQCFGN